MGFYPSLPPSLRTSVRSDGLRPAQEAEVAGPRVHLPGAAAGDEADVEVVVIAVGRKEGRKETSERTTKASDKSKGCNSREIMGTAETGYMAENLNGQIPSSAVPIISGVWSSFLGPK